MYRTLSPAGRNLAELMAAVFLLGLVPLFAKLIPLDAISIIFYRCAFGALGLLAFVAWRQGSLGLGNRRDYLRTLAVGILLAAHLSSYFHAIQLTTVAVAIAATFTFPVMTVLIEPLIDGARLRLMDLGLALVAFTGVALIAAPAGVDSAVLEGVLWGLFSAFMFALRNVLHRRWLSHHPSSQAMAYQLLVVVVCLVLVAEPPTAVDVPAWFGLALLGLVFTALAHSLFAGSMRHLPAKTAGLMASLQPVISIVAAAIVLAEIPGPRTMVGAAMVVSVAVIEGVAAPRRT
ncbi:DMT family transporter [Ectothiorhodospiraceae bacterium WFHF3C12]|nr:DMT family transporter [Ectothiorhodospiraceae bacterium WFHF3C12]